METVSLQISPARATGFCGPSEYLAQGGKNVVATPEFYWELEVKRLAKEFHPTEKFHKTPLESGMDDSKKSKPIQQNKMTVWADDSEFADYDRGAQAFCLGKEHWEEARKAWEELLNRPAAKRHERSVRAAFMLGKLAMKLGDSSAVKWFQMTRKLAQEGFSDPLGLAADSYGWEARSEWKQGHPEKAAPLYLTQLALGDESAVVSLKALIPDRTPVEGQLNYGPEPEDLNKWSLDEKKAAEQKTLLALKVAAADPLLRRLVTAHILATETGGRSFYSEASPGSSALRCSRWLSVVKEAKPGPLDDSEYLGWVAYNNGNYKEAERWLELAKADSAAACWLHAKLQLRAGKLADAEKSLSQAWKTLRAPDAYTGWNFSSNDSEFSPCLYHSKGGNWSFSQSASGDLAQLHLARNDFIQSLDTFLKGDLWEDAAFIAERVLTADELKVFVDNQPSLSGSENKSANEQTQKLRYLLGRRLVREDRYTEAETYLSPPYNKILAQYVKALQDGGNEKLPKQQRARAWFDAAWLARFDGMELMGSEVAPDGFLFDGEFESTDIAQERLSGKYVTMVYEKDEEKQVVLPVLLKPTSHEIERLKKNKISPDTRFHYRFIASALAIKAASLLADNTEELADVVNSAGNWVKNRDEKTANRYYQILEKQCPKTDIGRAAIAKHWFVDASGPWSKELQATYDALHRPGP